MRQGIKVEFSGGELMLFPLTLAQLQELEPNIRDLRALAGQPVTSSEINLRTAKVIAAAARKAHPEITPEKVLEMIDIVDVTTGVVAEAMRALMGRSGLAPVEVSEKRPLELVPEVVPALVSSIGDGSTPDSPPH